MLADQVERGLEIADGFLVGADRDGPVRGCQQIWEGLRPPVRS
jgi:hypothetical protein